MKQNNKVEKHTELNYREHRIAAIRVNSFVLTTSPPLIPANKQPSPRFIQANLRRIEGIHTLFRIAYSWKSFTFLSRSFRKA